MIDSYWYLISTRRVNKEEILKTASPPPRSPSPDRISPKTAPSQSRFPLPPKSGLLVRSQSNMSKRDLNTINHNGNGTTVRWASGKVNNRSNHDQDFVVRKASRRIVSSEG